MSNGWDILKQRGIYDVAIKAGWQLGKMSGVDGWIYPVFDASGKPYECKRWKACDSSHNPKYLWTLADAKRPNYYALPGTCAAIKDAEFVYIASGEPDVLAYHAAGNRNVLSWFGEKSVPETLAEDFEKLGIDHAIYVPDDDETGRLSALRVRELLWERGIQLDILSFGKDGSSKYDINKLWIDSGFDIDIFNRTLDGLKPLELPTGKSPQPTLPDAPDYDALYEEWCELVEREAIRTWNVPDSKASGFSRKNIPCPFHDDHNPSASWNYETHSLKCFAACDKDYNTHEIADALGVQTWDSFKAARVQDAPKRERQRTRDPQTVTANGSGKRPNSAEQPIRIVTSDEALSQVLDWMGGDVLPSIPILSPYKAMHHLGGMAQLWERRKLIYVIGGAGLGKTAFMETGIDILCQRGFDCWVWGPEWSPAEVQMKRIARYGGPSFSEQRSAHLWANEEKLKIPAGKRYGKPLTDEQMKKAVELVGKISQWPGKTHYLDKANAPLEMIMETVIDRSRQLREAGRDPVAFFCDYLQKSRLPGSNGKWHELEDKANVISYGIIEADLVGVVASQVGKASSRAMRQNSVLDESSAQALSDQLPNLFITLNPEFDKEGARLESATIGVAKNSSGFAPAEVRVKTALHRHLWTDQMLPPRVKNEPKPEDDED